jgi:hypothetical protein
MPMTMRAKLMPTPPDGQGPPAPDGRIENSSLMRWLPAPLTIRLRDSSGQPLPGRQLELLRADTADDAASAVAVETTDSTGSLGHRSPKW